MELDAVEGCDEGVKVPVLAGLGLDVRVVAGPAGRPSCGLPLSPGLRKQGQPEIPGCASAIRVARPLEADPRPGELAA